MRKIIAVDFDGTLCENAYPEIGAPVNDVIEYVIQARMSGAYIILWTCRAGTLLANAVDWCTAHGIEFDAINDNIPELTAKFENNSRKIYADIYLDDKALPVTEIRKPNTGFKRQRLTRNNRNTNE